MNIVLTGKAESCFTTQVFAEEFSEESERKPF